MTCSACSYPCTSSLLKYSINQSFRTDYGQPACPVNSNIVINNIIDSIILALLIIPYYYQTWDLECNGTSHNCMLCILSD